MKWLLWVLLSLSVSAQTLIGLENTRTDLSQLRRSGRPLVLVTWCSHCLCCRSGEHTLQALRKRYPQMDMWALDAQWGDDASQVKAYLRRQKLDLPVLFDPKAGLCRALGVRTSTTALVWDARGAMGYFGNLAGLDKALSQLSLGQSPQPASTPQQGCPILFVDHRDRMDHP